MKPPNPGYKKARAMLSEANRLCVLTGAGISAESGLKTFRDAGGLWEDHSIAQVATPEGFRADPRLVWRFYNARRKAADIAAPNGAHLALARCEIDFRRQAQKKKGHSANGNGHAPPRKSPAPFTLLTQNIDGLHQQAGSREVVELHGSLWKVRCTQCGTVASEFPIELPILPYCPDCGGLLRPHVVWFGEPLDPEVLAQADAAIQEADLVLVIGTSAVVEPAASYPLIAAGRGIPVIEVNKEATPVSAVAALCLRGEAGEILPNIIPR